MREGEIIIPESLHIVIDDLGWLNGEDDRAAGGPSRTAMPRRHCEADYRAINELGRRIGMQVSCAFVIGEWDPDNRLRRIPHLSKYGDGWNNAAYLDRDEMDRCIRAINESEYIDFAVHGLLHGNYREKTDNTDTSDFYYYLDGNIIMVEDSEVRKRLDAFFELVEYYGINKRINSFVPPSFVYRKDELSKILAEYGIKYISTTFKGKVVREDENTRGALVEECGIINLERNNNRIPWDMPGVDPTDLEVTSGILGTHWPNFLHPDAERNSEVIDKWVEYIKRCANTYGVVISSAISFAANQSLYHRYARMSLVGEKFMIDISDVPHFFGADAGFVISSRERLNEAVGASLQLIEEKTGFLNYRVIPKDKTVIIV